MLTGTHSVRSTRKTSVVFAIVMAFVTCATRADSAEPELPGPSAVNELSDAEDSVIRANGCCCCHAGANSMSCGSCGCAARQCCNGRSHGNCGRKGCRRRGLLAGLVPGGNSCRGCNSCGGCRMRLLSGGGRLRGFVCRFATGGGHGGHGGHGGLGGLGGLGGGLGLVGSRRNIPGCDMPGHVPYETWRMYYYYRPYQSLHVEELLSGISVGHYNAFSNEQFCDIHGSHAELIAVEHPITPSTPNNRRYLEFASCHEPLSTSSPADYHRPSVHLPDTTRDPQDRSSRGTLDHSLDLESLPTPIPAPLTSQQTFPISTRRIPTRSGESQIVDPATLRAR